jgi:hypothetical protein
VGGLAGLSNMQLSFIRALTLFRTKAQVAAQIAEANLGGGGGAATAQLVLNVPTVVKGYFEAVVADESVSATSKILATLSGELDAENDVEEISDSGIRVFAIPEAGQIRFVLTGHGLFVGDFKITYQVSS